MKQEDEPKIYIEKARNLTKDGSKAIKEVCEVEEQLKTWNEEKIVLTIQELWDFVFKEICLVCGLRRKSDFALSGSYGYFRRRFIYFINKKRRI